MNYKTVLVTTLLHKQHFNDRNIFRYHFVFRFIMPISLIAGSIYIFNFLNIQSLSDIIVAKSASFYILFLLAITSFFSSFYLLYFYNKSSLVMNELEMIIINPNISYKMMYSKIKKIIVTPFGNDIKKIEVVYNGKSISLYGFVNLKSILNILKLKVDNDKIFTCSN